MECAQDADEHALDLEALGHINRIHGAIGRLKADAAAFLVEALKGGVAFFQQGDDDIAIAGGFAALDDDIVAIGNVIFDHGIALHAQHIRAMAGIE